MVSSPSPIRFEKYEGSGNDFLVIEASDENAVSRDLAVALCNRHFGVGADGVLLILPARSPECSARMRVINADGSIPEMCGNGARCVALHIAHGERSAALRIETDAGIRDCQLERGGGQTMVTVDMGIVRVGDDSTLAIAGQNVAITVANAGNPHAVLFGDFSPSDAEQLGPRIATHPAFPRGTNVEFARVSGERIDLLVWERGVGMTSACGTGACAAVAVACSKGLARRGVPITVVLPGGQLQVAVDANGRATLRGPARHVFSGQLA
jgi:diaminopimelate epimerase